jgi:predicted GNAT family acetyltransferase
MSGWQQAGRRDLPAIVEFLLQDEALCVPFTSRLRAGKRGFELYFRVSESGAVTDCVLFTATGLLLPVLGPAADAAGLRRLLGALDGTVHSIMGVGHSVSLAEGLLPVAPTTRIEYFLMTLPRYRQQLSPPTETPGREVRKAGPADAESLFGIQKDYELEEVVIDPAHFNEGQCLRLLRHTLREELVYVVEQNGKPVAKASTNARGYRIDQIGGVYTVPELRCKGLARVVVSALLREIFQEKQAACLFVKKRNRPAIALYNRLGFEPVSDYVISYYGM